MENIIFDDQFKKLLPPLDEDAFARLEVDIVENGITYPLILWKNVLIDGYHRHAIATKHGLEFKVIEKEFDSRDEVIVWIITNQISRRNLNQFQLSYYRGLHYQTEKKLIGNRTGHNQHSQTSSKEQLSQNETIANSPSTATKLAEEYNVSRATIMRDAQLSDAIGIIGEVSPEAKEKILSGTANISRNRLQELASAPQDEIDETIEKILDGTHPRRISGSHNQTTMDNTQSNNTQIYEQLSLDDFITKITDEFTVGVKNLNLSADSTASKEKLRLYIKMLEELYNRI